MNRYPIWKYALVLIALVLGVIYALPNVYGQDPAVQVSLRDGDLPPNTAARVERILQSEGIEPLGMRSRNDTLVVRLADNRAQRRARAVLQDALGDDYVVAFSLAAAAPTWLRAIGAQPLNLGLDLRGGVHFVLAVDMEAAIENTLEQRVGAIRVFLREQGIRYRGATYTGEKIRIRFADRAEREQALEALEAQYSQLDFDTAQSSGRPILTATMTEAARRAVTNAAIEQNITTLRNRVNELGISDPVVLQVGEQRIIVQLPGVQNTARAKEILGATATLEFRLVHGTPADWRRAARTGRIPFGTRLFPRRGGGHVLLERQIIITGDQIVDASYSISTRTGEPIVSVRLNDAGADRMLEVTSRHVGDPMAVVYIENRVRTEWVDGEKVKRRERVAEVISVATIRDVFSSSFQISGLTSEEARDLALLLRAGSLSAPVRIIQARTIGPSLGQENIEQGFMAAVVGFLLVAVLLAIYYRVFGLIADIALLANLVFTIAILSLLQATLTLPGIAGIVLSIAMAVDANVLIYERIREELRAGTGSQSAIAAGYDRAFSAIFDGNITVLMAAALLFIFGTGPIKGFGVTLAIGVAASMFTALMGTRALVNLIYGGRRGVRLHI